MKVDQAYNNWAQTYDIDRNLTRDLDAHVIKKILRAFRPKSVIELGCGTGKNTAFLARISKKVLALDFSEGMISKARAKVAATHVSFALADLSKRWPSKNASADLVVGNLVLEHIKNLRPIFSEARRVLVPGGVFYLSELHPFRQYDGKQANFTFQHTNIAVPAFTHHISDFLTAADKNGLSLVTVQEWWHEEDKGKPPRLATFMFGKGIRSAN